MQGFASENLGRIKEQQQRSSHKLQVQLDTYQEMAAAIAGSHFPGTHYCTEIGMAFFPCLLSSLLTIALLAFVHFVVLFAKIYRGVFRS